MARPIGSAIFGHFGDRVGRKTTLVAALLTMGLSTVAIGLLPTYATIGVAAPVLLAVCRFGQGLGLGGEWGGAVLLAIENAPPGKRAWYGMFPQLGAPIGFFFSGGSLSAPVAVAHATISSSAFGWRIPVSRERCARARRALRSPDDHRNAGLPGAVARSDAREGPDDCRVSRLSGHAGHRDAGLACHVRAVLPDDGLRAVVGNDRTRIHAAQQFLLMQLFGILFFALTIPLSAILAERGRRRTLIWRDHRHRALRPRHGADVRVGHRAARC